MADWLDAPIGKLRRSRTALVPTFTAGLVLALTNTILGHLLGSVSSGMNPASPADFAVAGLLSVSLVTTTVALTTVLEMVLCTGVDAVERRRPTTALGVVQDALRKPLVTAAVARLMIHLSLAILTICTCGLGLVAWLTAALYLPLIFPVAVREQVGGLQAALRSVNLLAWKPSGGPWYGSVDRVVIAYHVVAAVGYALWALPNVPLLAWTGAAFFELIASGSTDLTVAQQALTPPAWLSLPVGLLSSVLGLLPLMYSQQLYLDLHQDLRNRREGTDLHAALDRMEAPPADVP